MTPGVNDPSFDEQDQSEVFDEDNLSVDEAGGPGAELRTFEEIPDVFDATQVVGDSDEEAALIGEDLEAEDAIALSEDGDATDIEDDDLAARDGEAVSDDRGGLLDAQDVALDAEAGLDAADRRLTPEAPDEVSLIYAGDATNFAEGQTRTRALESDRLIDDDIADLGYDDKGEDGRAAAPVRFEIMLRNGLWTVLRDGDKVHDYSHLERATREVNALARELRRTGQPAEVFVEAADGKAVQIVEDAQIPAPPVDEASAVVPDRSESG